MAESWRVVEHSWARTSIYCGETPICSLSIEETATEENQEDLELEMAKHARLIAAAPELLEACKEALKAFESNACIDWSLLSTAILKAEGVK